MRTWMTRASGLAAAWPVREVQETGLDEADSCTFILDSRDDLPCPLSDPSKSLVQVHVRTPSEAQETFRGRAGSATGVAQTVRPQPGDATADSQSARLSHSPPRDVRGKRNPARRPSAGCLLCNPRVASFRLAAHGTRTRPQTPLPFGEWTRACLSRGGSGGARVSRGEFFGPDGTGDAPVHLAGPMRKRKPEAPFTSRCHVGGRPKKLGASCSPRRSDG